MALCAVAKQRGMNAHPHSAQKVCTSTYLFVAQCGRVHSPGDDLVIRRAGASVNRSSVQLRCTVPPSMTISSSLSGIPWIPKVA